jgi:glyceraldehyde 3-phosphate dehydrogenase
MENRSLKVAINGFGRIGRSVFRILEEVEGVDLVAVNDLFDHDALRYLLQYDTVMGNFGKSLALEDDHLVTPKSRVAMLSERDPAALPWAEMGVDVVVEATGVFRTREQLQAHLDAGAGRVLLTVPAKDEIDYTVVLGVNDAGLNPDHRIISNASCTTNCLAPMAKILHEAFGIEEGVIDTVHAYTNDQRLADVPHTDWRRSRAAAQNIIPTSTGAAKAVGQVLPDLQGRLHGIAARVPVADGSVVDLFVTLATRVTVDDVNAAVREASESEALRGILQYGDAPIVSSDIIGNPYSSIYDAAFTAVSGGKYLRTLNWYDNEWGYSSRVCDLLQRFSAW